MKAAIAAVAGVLAGVALSQSSLGGMIGKLFSHDAEVTSEADLVGLVPAREIIVQRGDALVFGRAKKPALVGDASTVSFLARASLTYSADLRQLGRKDFSYDPARDILSVRIPPITVKAAVDPKTKVKFSSLNLFTTEGGTGNELERLADRDLQARAVAEGRRKAAMAAAEKAARYEVSELYEQAFRQAGQRTRVEVSIAGGPAS